MSAVRILAACSPGEMRAAAVQDGVLLDYAVHRGGMADQVGDRVRGRVINHVPGMAGAFVALPGGSEGFLPDSAGAAGLGAGDAITVGIVRAAQSGKGPRLTGKVEQGGPGAPALLSRGPDAIARLRALYPQAEIVVDDPGALPPGALAADTAIRCVPRAWDEDVASQVAELAQSAMDLGHGVVARVHPTPALVAIDLDAAPDARRPKSGAQREANLAALPGLARAIRLRNLSGAIVIDLAGMTVKARASLGGPLAAALADDPLRPRFLGFSALGLAEVLRPRIYPPLHELLAGPHAAGLAAARALITADAGARWVVVAALDVARALEQDKMAAGDVARRTGHALTVKTDPALPPGSWRLEEVKRG